MSRIWDCFTYANEWDCLTIRRKEFEWVLDCESVAIESNFTFTGKQKHTQINNASEFVFGFTLHGFVDNKVPNNGNAWDNEAHQRNYILTALKELNAQDDDIVIISDADEIPRLEAVRSYKPEMGLTALRMDVFWYKFNCLAEKQTWTHPRIMTYGYLKNTTPQRVRESGYSSVIDNAGWHFSYLGDEKYISNKLSSFSHTEYNTPQYNNEKHIRECIENGISLWGASDFEFVKIDKTFPEYLRNNQEKFKHLIADVWELR